MPNLGVFKLFSVLPLLCSVSQRGLLTLCFPGSGWFWTVEGTGKSEKNMECRVSSPIYNFFFAFSSIKHLCVFCSFYYLSIYLHDYRFLSVNTGLWLGLNLPFILFLLIGISSDVLLFGCQLFYYLCNQIKSPLVENTWSGFYFSGSPEWLKNVVINRKTES